MRKGRKRYISSTVCFTLLISVLTVATMTKVEASSKIESMIDAMSVEEKITQMLMPDFRKWKAQGASGESDMTQLDPEVAEIIDTYDFGGVILFAENVKATEQTAKLTSDLQNAAITNTANNGNIPLLITVDQEGGIVYRLGSGTALPGNMALGASRSVDNAKRAGQIIGRELSALGINVDFAPALDVNSNPNNPVIGLRSFSSKPELVAELAVPMIQGIQEYNVATAAKHFPGHGDTASDSHTGLPRVDKTYEELATCELVPFQAAVDNGVDMLMTAHIQFPKIETDTVLSKLDGQPINIPATLSDDIITGIVRNKMHYNGIVITDAMNMDAIAKNFGESDAVIMAMQADVDICLMPTILRSKADLAKLDTIINDVKQAIEDGQLSIETLNNSVRRILELKEKRGILDYASNYPGWDAQLAKAKVEVGSTLNRQIEREIAAAGVTMVKNDNNVLPLKPKDNEKVLLLGAYPNELPGMELSMRRLLDAGVLSPNVQYESFNYTSTTTDAQLQEKIDASDYVVVISEIGNASQLAATNWLTAKPTSVVSYANSKDIPVVVMSISKPYDVANYSEAKAVIAVYGNKGMDPTEGLQPDNAFGPNIPAGIEAIFGGIEIQGKLPVDVPKITDGVMDTATIQYPFGHGLTYKDVVKNIQLRLPSDPVIEGDTFITTIELNDLQSIPNDDYKVVVTINDTDLTILENENYTIQGNQVVFKIPAIQNQRTYIAPMLEIYLRGNHEKENTSVVSTIEVIDAKDRTFSMGDNAYSQYVIDIVKKVSNPIKPDDKGVINPDQKKATLTKKPSTSDATPLYLFGSIAFVSGLFIVWMGIKRNERNSS